MSASLNLHPSTGLWSRLTASQRCSAGYVLPGLALIAVGVFSLASLAVSPPTAVTLGTVLFLGGVVEAGGGFANIRRKDALLHVLVGVLAIEAGFIFRWLAMDALVPVTVVITALLALGAASVSIPG